MLITNIDLAQSIISRYTSFLSIASSGADLRLLEPPVSAEGQESITLRRQEIRHIHNCIEQNTMVSVNLNLRFLNNMITRAVEQVGKENRHAAKMLERPMVLNSTEKHGSVRIDAPATRTLLRELRQNETKEIFHASTPPPRSSDPAQILLQRSLTQLVTQAANPVIIEYPTPDAGKNGEALTRPMVHSSELAEALPQESSADHKAHAAPPQPLEKLSSANLIPRRPRGEEKRESADRKSEAPTITSLARSAAEAPPKSDIILKTPPIGQTIEAPPRTLPKAPSVEARAAAEAPPIGQTIEASPRTMPKAPAVEARAAAEAPPKSDIILKAPPIGQTIEAPPRTLPKAHSAAHSAAEAPTQSDIILKAPPIEQAIEAPPRTLPKAPAMVARAAAEAPPKSDIVFKAPPIVEQSIEASPRTMPKAPAVEARAAAHSAPEAPPKSDIVFKAPPIGQSIEAPPRTLLKAPAVAVRAAAEAPPIEAPPRTLPKAPAVAVRAAAEAPSQPATVITLPKPRQQIIPIGAREQTTPYNAPLSVQANQASIVHPSMADRQAVPQEPIAVQLNPTRKVTRIYRKGMLPARSEAAQINPQPSQLSRVSQRNDIPAARVLREEAKPTARPKPKASADTEDDIVDIPTVRVQKNVTKEIGQQSTRQNAAINAPQNSKTTLFTEPAQEISEAELVRITNQVYHTLESRLRNEKMRRGMW